MAKKKTSALDKPEIEHLSRLVEESMRSTREGARFFIEPAQGTLSRGLSKRHHIIFGRRGSGKSSLLVKIAADLTVDRRPIASVDLEEFKGHSYPDVLVSVLIKALTEFQSWLDSAAINPATKKRFWDRLFGSKPTRKAFDKHKTKALSIAFAREIETLKGLLFSADEFTVRSTTIERQSKSITGKSGATISIPSVSANTEVAADSQSATSNEMQSEYASKKIEFLHRNIIAYKNLFTQLIELSDGEAFLLLDDLYHIRISDQASV